MLYIYNIVLRLKSTQRLIAFSYIQFYTIYTIYTIWLFGCLSSQEKKCYSECIYLFIIIISQLSFLYSIIFQRNVIMDFSSQFLHFAFYFLYIIFFGNFVIFIIASNASYVNGVLCKIVSIVVTFASISDVLRMFWLLFIAAGSEVRMTLIIIIACKYCQLLAFWLSTEGYKGRFIKESSQLWLIVICLCSSLIKEIHF